MQAIQWVVWPRYKMRMEGEEGMALARLDATSCVKNLVIWCLEVGLNELAAKMKGGL